MVVVPTFLPRTSSAVIVATPGVAGRWMTNDAVPVALVSTCTPRKFGDASAVVIVPSVVNTVTKAFGGALVMLKVSVLVDRPSALPVVGPVIVIGGAGNGR